MRAIGLTQCAQVPVGMISQLAAETEEFISDGALSG